MCCAIRRVPVSRIFPFIISRRRLGPFKIVSIDLLGADPALTEIRAPLI